MKRKIRSLVALPKTQFAFQNHKSALQGEDGQAAMNIQWDKTRHDMAMIIKQHCDMKQMVEEYNCDKGAMFSHVIP
jgi:uncharacterized protein YqfA (UPF0365 family)